MKKIILSLCVVLVVMGSALAETDFPKHDLTLIVQATPGGTSDFITRAFSSRVETLLGKRINVIYKPGASGSIGMGALADSKPDGYTIGVLTGEVSTLKSLGYPQITPDKFDYIALVVKVPTALVVYAKSPYNNLAEFVAAAKKSPGKITVGVPGYGAAFYLSMRVFEKEAGITLKYIPFDSCAPVIVAVLGQHVDAGACALGESMPHFTAKTMRSLGVMSAQRMPQLPDIPTFQEQGFDVALGSWAGFGTPKGVPPEVLTKLRKAFAQVYNDPEVVKTFNDRGFLRDLMSGDAYQRFAEDQSKVYANVLAHVQAP